MSSKTKQQHTFENMMLPGKIKLTAPSIPVAANSIPMEFAGFPMLRARFLLAGKTISMAAASDFGAIQLCDLPNKNLILAGAMIDAAYTVAGFATNTGVTTDWAIGTVTTASVDFSNTGEDNLMEKVDGVGATAAGTVKGHSFDMASPALIFLDAAATNDVFLNASQPVTSGTGVITFTGGFVDIFYHDLGEPAA